MPSLIFNYGNWWNWEDYPDQKAVFDGPNKIIYISEGVRELDVQVDLYSAWKEWKISSPEAPGSEFNPRGATAYDQAFTAIGGDPITDSQNVGITYFLENGWRIQPFASKDPYVLTVDGNLYTREVGENPFLFAEGVSTSLVRSNIVDLIRVEAIGVNITEQDLAAIADSVWDEALTDHTSDGTTGKKLGKIATKVQDIALR
jgi:hypothetical protein